MWFERSSWEHPKINQNVEWNSACLEEKGIRASSNEEGSITFRQLARPPVHSLWLASGHSNSSSSSPVRHHTPYEILQGPPGSWCLALSDRYGASKWNSVMLCIQLSPIWKLEQPGNSHDITGQLPAWSVTQGTHLAC